MKICFIPWVLENYAVKKAREFFSVGIGSLIEIIKINTDVMPIVFDINAHINLSEYKLNNDQLYIDMAKELADNNSDIYGFSTIAEGFEYQLIIANELKKIKPQCTILMGGPQASVSYEDILTHFNFIDFILIGESEISIVQFLEYIKNKKNINEVNNLAYRHKSKILKTLPNNLVNLDELPYIDFKEYYQKLGAIPIEVGRGCPFNCKFCSTSKYFANNFRIKSIENLVKEIKYYINEYNCYYYEFIHDLLTYDKKYICNLCNELLRCNIKITWSCSARADLLDKNLLDLMKQAGCIAIFFGIESGSEKTQKAINKNLNIKKSCNIIEYTRKIGIKVTASFVIGFPQETPEDLLKTLILRNIIIKLDVNVAHPKILMPLRGSIMYDETLLNNFSVEYYKLLVDKQNVNKIVTNLISKYPTLFSAYYTFKSNYFNQNCINFLFLFISSNEYPLSEKMLIDYKPDIILDIINKINSISHIITNRQIVLTIEDTLKHYSKDNIINIIFNRFLYEKNISLLRQAAYNNTVESVINVEKFDYDIIDINLNNYGSLDSQKIYYAFLYDNESHKIDILNIDESYYYKLRKETMNDKS